ncbi:MAG: galactose-1-phosphate uridylyltransferase, partial [Actinobacteria bacterium]|nr:galactose-1-phosphate uridylyltransferase [Actinomycetota bacterium]
MLIMSSKKLGAGVVRTDRFLMDGRTIRYYDTQGQSRDAVDQREVETQPQIGEMRLDALNNEWVVMAAHRQGRVFLPPKELNPLAPSRPGFLTEIPESDYEVVVFDNRSPSLRSPDGEINLPKEIGFDTPPVPAAGKCEVVCFTSNYEASFKDLSHRQIRTVLEAWRDRVAELSSLPYIEHIAPFENRGEEVGVTLSHPHGQIYAYPYLPPRTENMLEVAKKHRDKTGRVLLDDLVAREIKDEVRIVARSADWVAFVPYAA